MKFFLIAGEKSGDLHASNLMKAILQKDPDADFRYYGGDSMKAVGGELIHHFDKMAFMGGIEVLRNLKTIKAYMREAVEIIDEWKPDVVILIDYGGFNMRIAKMCKPKGHRIFYYITPKVWAWNQKRAYKIQSNTDRAFVILPFEKDFFKKKCNLDVDYVGNPVKDAVKAFTPDPEFISKNNLGDKKIIAVLPGSRKQEIEKMLKTFAKATPGFEDYTFVIGAVKNYPREYFESVAEQYNMKVVYDQTYDLLNVAYAALVCSGTATLETALFNVPQVVCYKTAWITYTIGSMLVKIDFFSLVNLIVGREVVQEMLQGKCTPATVSEELKRLTADENYRAGIFKGYDELNTILGEENVSEKSANLMWNYLNGSKS